MIRLDDDDVARLSRFGTGPDCARCAEREALRAAMDEDRQTLVDGGKMRAHTVTMQEHDDTKPLWQLPDNVPLFTMMTVAKAADVPIATVRAWFQRGHVTLGDGDAPYHVKGASNKFTLRSVLMLATTAELIRLGTTPATAFKAVEHWMVHGVLKEQYGAPARREGGGLFPKPYQTYLIVGAEGQDAGEWPSQIVGIDPRSPTAHAAFFNGLFHRGRASAKIILLNMLDRRVRRVCHQTILGEDAPSEPDWDAEVEQMLADDSV